MLWTTSFGPFGSLVTLSQTSMMAPQSSEVRFSSVALAGILSVRYSSRGRLPAGAFVECIGRRLHGDGGRSDAKEGR